ncbi:NAD(P)-dependent oxidoreductase [Yoonia sp.]|uniref:NAD(P)-dependent oxidoreductase n=1 Tax=Yoonia sp. TaxID=2212373 RepID=UPI002FDA9FDF
MKLLVLGATGRTGREVVKAAQKAGHHVTSFGRRVSEDAEVSLTGQFGDAAFVAAVSDADAVLSCLASTNTDPVCSRAAEAVFQADPKARFLTVAGAAVARPGDDKGLGDRLIGLVMKLVAGRMLADRQKEVDMLAASTLRWTALRPPRLTSGKPAGGWRFDFDRPHTTAIDRADLAAAMLAALEDEKLVGQAPFVSGLRGAA